MVSEMGVDISESASGVVSSSLAQTEYLVYRTDFAYIL